MVAVQVLDSGGSLVDTVTLAAYAALANARCRTHIPAGACCCVVFAHHTTHGLFSVHSVVRLRRLPKLHVVSVGTKDGGGEELDIEVDEDPNAAVAIDASGVPITVTFCQVQCRLAPAVHRRTRPHDNNQTQPLCCRLVVGQLWMLESLRSCAQRRV